MFINTSENTMKFSRHCISRETIWQVDPFKVYNFRYLLKHNLNPSKLQLHFNALQWTFIIGIIMDPSRGLKVNLIEKMM